MAQKLRVDLEFRANTDAAKKQIQSLQQTLNSAISSSTMGKDLGLTPKLEQARLHAMQLKTALESATNVDTGRLNLHKFTNQLRSSGLNVQQLAVSLKQLGPDGVKAFGQMTSAMASAETKLFSIQGGMRRLVNTFANTMRYQASAMAIQTVTKSITSAISYTKELDRSLTDIWMVTGKSAEEMNRLAITANKAAKSLAASTNEYLKASQIYFQQGLDTGESMKRAEITIKLAHATGESMEEVSNWMTAIWNNFDDGTHTLTYYADVLAKLGAATASSADEIAQGLEKFAAVAETVGLSYEYAASALATITAETRQSADVVGTALKTLFSRMESLKLGDTLDDGTSLNKYSLALKTVGVDIKDASGGLKDMDMILDETAVKWETLSKDQQVALAQSVAGVRQYTQFIALMDNYDVMKNNIAMSKAATGSLEEMQRKYENSIEGIQAATKATGEGLISALMDEDDIKRFYKAMSGIMDFATKLTKAFGGLEGILLMAANALMKMYQPQIANMFTNMAMNIREIPTHIGNAARRTVGLAEKQTYAQQQQSAAIDADKALRLAEGGDSMSGARVTEKIHALKKDLLANERQMSEAQKNQLQWQIQLLERVRDTLVEEENELNVLKEQQSTKESLVNASVPKNGQAGRIEVASSMDAAATNATSLLKGIDPTAGGQAQVDQIRQILVELQRAKYAAQELGKDVRDMGFEDAIGDLVRFSEGAEISFETVKSKVDEVTNKIANMAAYERSGASSAGVVIDAAAMNNRSAALGTVSSGVNQTVNLAKSSVGMDLNTSDKQQLGQQMLETLNQTSAQAEKLGLNLKDLGFDIVKQDIQQMATDGTGKLQELIAKLEEFQSKAKGGISSALNATVEDAGVNAILGKEGLKGMETIDNISDSDSVDKRATQALEGTKALGDNKTEKMATAEKKLLDLQKQKATLQKKYQQLDQTDIKQKANLRKQLQQVGREMSKEVGIIKKENGAVKSGVKQSAKYNELMEERGEAMQNSAQGAHDVSEKQEDLNHKTEDTISASERMANSMNKASSNAQMIGQTITNVGSQAMSVVTGLNMMTNGVASLTSALSDGKLSWSEFLSTAMSIIPGLMQLAGPIAKTTSWLLAKGAAAITAAKMDAKAAEEEGRTSKKRIGYYIATGVAKVAEWMTKGPWGWVIAGIGAAALATLGVAVAVKKGAAKGQEEKEEAQNESRREVNSAAGEVTKNLTGLSENIDTFKNLRESGESTVDVLKDMANQVKDINFQIDELMSKAKEGGSTDDWKFLERAKEKLNWAQGALETGAIDADEYQDIVDSTIQTTNQTASKAALDTLRSTGSDEDLDAYLKQVGTTVQSSENLMKDAEAMFLAGQPYETADEARKAWGDAVIDTALGPKYADLDSAESDKAISALMSYAPYSVNKVINALSLFDTNGALENQYGKTATGKIKSWAQSKGGAAEAYLNDIDFSQPEDTWDSQYAEAVQQQTYAQNTMEATKYGVSDKAFEAYTEDILENNEALEGSEALASEIALQNVKMSKGIGTLITDYDKYKDVLEEGESAGWDYYEALASVQTMLSDTFGFEVSDEFVEKNLGLIQSMADGSVEALEALRAQLADEFIATFEYRSATNEDGGAMGLDIAEQKALLQNIALDAKEMGTDLNLAPYYDQLNEMIRAGQLTTEEIQGFFGSMNLAVEIPDREWVETGKVKHTYYSNGEVIREEDESIQELLPVFGENVKVAEAPQSKVVMNSAKRSSGTKTSKEDEEKMKDEIGRYHEIQAALEDIERELEKISKAKDRAFGKSKVALMEQEIAAQEQYIKTQEEYLKQIQAKYDEDVAELDSRFSLDPITGQITNYTEVLESLIGNVSEETYNEIKENADQYEETLEEMKNQSDAVIDAINDKLDMELEKIETEVEVDLQFNEADTEYLDYLMGKMDDPAQDAAEKMALLTRKGNNAIENAQTIMSTGIENVLKKGMTEEQKAKLDDIDLSDIDVTSAEGLDTLQSRVSEALGEDFILDASVVESLQGQLELLYDEAENIDAAYEDVMSTVGEAFDDMNEKAEKAINRNEQLGESLQNFRNIIDLVGKDKLGVSYEQLNSLGEANVTQSLSNLSLKQSQLDSNRKALDAAKAGLATAEAQGDEKAIAEWKAQIETIEENIWNLEGEVETAWGDTLQVISDTFASAVQNATDAFEDAMTGQWGSYEKMQEVFDQQQEIADRYVDDYKKIYELSKLNRDLNKSIDSTDSVKAKQALKDLQEEINELQKDGKKVSQYEIDHLRKKYELRLAEIALEDAQNAKSQVRMQRDQEGNWSYVYSADQSKIDQSQQNFEDRLYAIQELEQNYIDEMQSRVISAETQMIEAINALRVEDFATQEEYQAEVTRITEYYTGLRNYALDELNKGIEDSKETYEEDWSAYSQSTGYKISADTEWTKSFANTKLALVTGYENIESARSTFDTNVNNMVTAITGPDGAYARYEGALKEAFNQIGIDLDNFSKEGGTLDTHITTITDKLGTINSAFGTWKTDADAGFAALTTAASSAYSGFAAELKKYNEDISATIALMNALIELAGTNLSEVDDPTEEDEGKDKPKQGGKDGGSGGGGGGADDTGWDVAAKTTLEQHGDTEFLKIGNKAYKKSDLKEGEHYIVDAEGNYMINTEAVAGKEFSHSIRGISDKQSVKDARNTKYYKIGDYWYTWNQIKDHVIDVTDDGYEVDTVKLKGGIKNVVDKSTAVQDLFDSKKSFVFQLTNSFPISWRSGQGRPNDKDKTKKLWELSAGVYTYIPVEHGVEGGAGYLAYGDSVSNDKVGGVISDDDLFWSKEIKSAILSKFGSLVSFDTGGYTGSWDSTGRIAMLHQKELVLNTSDTENFLAAVNIVRDIANAIDLQALSHQRALGSIASAQIANSTAQTLEQTVTIHAEFPNATQRSEIEAAFDTLLNRASQFANRKN